MKIKIVFFKKKQKCEKVLALQKLVQILKKMQNINLR